MKHRSVIAFVIVAAALFSLPQLSHDLQWLKGAVGARLQRELLHAFLNLPAGEPTAAAPAARPAETLFASCTQKRSGAPAAKSGKVEAGGRGQGRAAEKSVEQSAMIGDPAQDPINGLARAEIKAAVGGAFASLPELKVETEVAMIIPPDRANDPRVLARALPPNGVARFEADRLRAEAEGLRVAYAAAARLQADGSEWEKSVAEALRKFEGSAQRTYQFRVVREGAKTKVVKSRSADCPSTLPRAPLPMPAAAPLPAPSAPAEWAGE